MTRISVDDARWQLVPCLDDMFETVAAVLPYAREEAIDILDLGGRRGELSVYLLNRFPNAYITLLDASEDAVELARHEHSDQGERLKFLVRDFARDDLPIGFHAIVSSFALHHLNNIDIRGLYRSAYSSLHAGGMLIIADRVTAPSSMLADRYRNAWLRAVARSGASDEEIAEAEERQQADNQTPVLEHLHWLQQAGFRDIDVFYRNLIFSVHGGRRPKL